ncbi:MAG: hypothetical protein ACNA7K_03105 [Acholeplasmataceae bacterium]
MLYHDLKKKRVTAFVIYALVMIFPHLFLVLGMMTSPSYIAFIIPLYVVVSLMMTAYLFYYLHNITSFYIHLVVKVSINFKQSDLPSQMPLKIVKKAYHKDLYYRYNHHLFPKAFIKTLQHNDVVLNDTLKVIHPTNKYHLKALSKPYDYALIKDLDQHLYIVHLNDLNLYKEKAKS